MADTVRCRACGRQNPPDQRFCGECGTSLAVVCSTCGTGNPPDFRFCGSCGAALGARAEPAAVEERRIVTVLFADLVGFTSRAEKLDPEDVRAILSPYYVRLRAELERFGGTVEKFIGDAVVAAFGAPVAHGDDPERAVRAALAIRSALAELNSREPELDLQARIAVNTGEAIVALGRRADQGEGMVAGDVVNTAARLQTAAPVNGILVGEETWRATQQCIRYEQVAPVVAKGKQAPVRAWLALEATSALAERAERGVPMVGRDYELGVLRGTWERVVGEGRPHLITVFGPPGIGKTRLASEFWRFVESRGERVVRGRSLPYGESSSYGAFAQQVKQVAGIFDSDPTPVACQKLEQTVAALLESDDAEEVSTQLAALIGLSGERAAVDRQVAFFAARRLIEALVRDRPTLLVFEDIHWADPGLLDLLESLGGRLRDVPVLLLTLARPELLETRPSWGGGLPAYTALPLEPLTKEQSRQLAQNLLGGERGLAPRIAETAEGNPLFLEELAASVAERPTGAAEELPANVRGIIAARLDTLGEAERALLLSASVIGKVFWHRALEALAADPDSVPQLLDSLERRDLIRREPISRIQGDAQFVFKHVLIRDVAYATLPRATRRERHARVAEFFEQAVKERLGEWADVLAYHWHEAGDAERELEYLLLAAARAWPHDAIGLFARAIELVPMEEAARRHELQLAQAKAYVQAGDYNAALAVFDALPEFDGRARFTALTTRANAYFWLADAATARRFGEQAWQLAVELGDDEAQVIARVLLARVGAMDGRLSEAIEHSERALAEVDAKHRPRDHADAALWSGLEHYWIGKYDVALERSQLAYEIGQDAHHSEAILQAGSHVGLALAGLGRHEEALPVLDRVTAQGAEFEFQPRFTGRAMNMWAGTLREVYALDEARVLNERAIELGRQANFPGSQVSGRIDLLVTDLLEGELGRPETEWPKLWEAAVATKGWHQWLWMTRLRHAKAELALAAGRSNEAAEEALAAISDAERYRRLKYATASRVTLGAALLELGRHDDAVTTLRLAHADAEQLRHPPTIWRAAAQLAAALAAVGADEAAERAAVSAREAVARFAAGLSEERRARFEQAPQLAEILALAR